MTLNLGGVRQVSKGIGPIPKRPAAVSPLAGPPYYISPREVWVAWKGIQWPEIGPVPVRSRTRPPKVPPRPKHITPPRFTMLLPPCSASSGPIYLLVIFLLAIVLVPAQPCMLHGPKSFAKLGQVGLHLNPHFKTSDRLQAQNKALDHLEKHKAYREKEAEWPQVRQMSSNSVSDSTYMKLALAAAMECYGPCPALAYGAILVHRPTNEIVMHSCNTAYLDATQHAEMNTIQFAARYYPNHTEAWWSSLTLYTTAEPCPMCMAAARWTGVGEIVFGTSIPTQASYGWESIDVPAQQINSASNHLSTSTLLRGPFETSLTNPYFAWQFNQTAPCPPGCHRDIISNRCNFFF